MQAAHACTHSGACTHHACMHASCMHASCILSPPVWQRPSQPLQWPGLSAVPKLVERAVQERGAPQAVKLDHARQLPAVDAPVCLGWCHLYLSPGTNLAACGAFRTRRCLACTCCDQTELAADAAEQEQCKYAPSALTRASP